MGGHKHCIRDRERMVRDARRKKLEIENASHLSSRVHAAGAFWFDLVALRAKEGKMKSAAVEGRVKMVGPWHALDEGASLQARG